MTRRLPILFSAPMMLALLDGRKTMTRRYAWSTCSRCDGGGLVQSRLAQDYLVNCSRCGGPGHRATIWQSVRPGDVLYTRENFRVGRGYDDVKPSELPTPADTKIRVWYEADGKAPEFAGKLRPGIHMPEWMGRVSCVVGDTKIENAQAISFKDVLREGFVHKKFELGEGVGLPNWSKGVGHRQAWKALWVDLHGEDSWNENPELVAMGFREVLRTKPHG